MPSTRPSLLAVDDDTGILGFLSALAVRQGYDVATSTTADGAVAGLRRRPADLVLLDLRMPGVDGLDGLRRVRQASPGSRVVLMTGFGTIDAAVEATKLGATDCLTKPFEMGRLRRLLEEVRALARPGVRADAESEGYCGLLGRSPAMQAVYALIGRLAPHAQTVLVTGETGTGKELAARAFHQMGPRSRRRLVTVNCSAVVEALFESELFGHMKGAFTGATESKSGLIETADGGTLFLDEVGELPLPVQAKLLRVIEYGEVQRVGGLEPRRVDIRLVAATNRDLRAEAAAGRFRADLYYRLNLAEVCLPPLDTRREDIPELAKAFLAIAAKEQGRQMRGIDPEALALLERARWPGNVRQLRNVVARACMLTDADVLGVADLDGTLDDTLDGTTEAPPDRGPVRASGPPATPGIPLLRTVQRDHLVSTLQHAGGNKVVAARLLGISRRAFYRQLERHGLHRPVATAQ